MRFIARCMAVISVSLGTFVPAVALACGGPPPLGFVGWRSLLPADGSTGVPTNARIVVWYQSGGQRPDHVAVEDHPGLATADGLPVPVGVTRLAPEPGWATQDTFVLVPVEPLQPQTQYVVLSDFANPPCVQDAYWLSVWAGGPYKPCTVAAGAIDGGAIDGGAVGVPVAVSRFTTGAGPDTEPPRLSGTIALTATPESCSGGACCGPYEGFSVAMQWTMAADQGTVFYEVAHDGQLILYPHESAAAVGAFLCSGTKTSVLSSAGADNFQGPPGRYEVVAVDLAGNRSAPIAADVHPCDDESGCSCHAGAGRGGLGTVWVPGLLLGGLLHRRRRSRRSRGDRRLPR